MATHTYYVEFVMIFRGEIEAASEDEAQSKLEDVETGDVWNDWDWTLENTERRITGSADDDDETDGKECA